MTIPTLNLGKPRPSLTPAQRFELAGASVKNAIDLRGDARLLAEADRPQHAAFLLVACVEELVKAHLCLRAEPEDWKDFWTTFRDHPRKLGLLDEVDESAEPMPDGAVKMLQSWRERCLYVEVSHQGNPQTPMGLVDPGGLDGAGLAPWTAWIDRQIPRFIGRLETLEPTMRGKGPSPRPGPPETGARR